MSGFASSDDGSPEGGSGYAGNDPSNSTSGAFSGDGSLDGIQTLAQARASDAARAAQAAAVMEAQRIAAKKAEQNQLVEDLLFNYVAPPPTQQQQAYKDHVMRSPFQKAKDAVMDVDLLSVVSPGLKSILGALGFVGPNAPNPGQPTIGGRPGGGRNSPEPDENSGGDNNFLRQLLSNPDVLNIANSNDELSTGLLEQQKTGFRSDIGDTFTGEAFGNIDDDIISSIINERRGPGNNLIANAGARGNFNPTGGAAANKALDEQEVGARQRISDVGSGLFSESQFDINSVGDRARTEVDNFTLGGDFDLQPFSDERQGIIDTRVSGLGTDLRTNLGADPLFDPQAALQAGGREQGAVSGAPSNQSLLDTITQRQQNSSSNRRGLNTGGSGAF